MQWGQDLTISYFYAGLQAWLSVVLIIRCKLWVPLMRPIGWVFLVWALGWRLQQGWWGRWQQEWAGWYKWPPLHTACCSVKRSHVIFLHVFHKSVEIKHLKFWSSIWKQRFCSFYPNFSWVSNFLPSCDPWPSLTSLPARASDQHQSSKTPPSPLTNINPHQTLHGLCPSGREMTRRSPLRWTIRGLNSKTHFLRNVACF